MCEKPLYSGYGKKYPKHSLLVLKNDFQKRVWNVSLWPYTSRTGIFLGNFTLESGSCSAAGQARPAARKPAPRSERRSSPVRRAEPLLAGAGEPRRARLGNEPAPRVGPLALVTPLFPLRALPQTAAVAVAVPNASEGRRRRRPLGALSPGCRRRLPRAPARCARPRLQPPVSCSSGGANPRHGRRASAPSVTSGEGDFPSSPVVRLNPGLARWLPGVPRSRVPVSCPAAGRRGARTGRWREVRLECLRRSWRVAGV